MIHPPVRSQRRPPRDPNAVPTWRERLAALRYVPPLLRLVWDTHRGYTATMAVLRFARSFVPVATLWIGKLIIDAVVGLRGGGGARFSRLWELVALENAATLDLEQFEDPAFYDQLERARRQTVGRIGILSQLLNMGQDSITLLTLGTALFVYSPWLLLLLAIAVVPAFMCETHFASLEYSLLYRWTPERRQLDYLRYLGASDKTAKEVQMFGLASWLVDRYRALADRFYQENKRLSIRKGIVSTLFSFFGTLGYYAAYVIILMRALRGTITIGSLT